MAPYPGPAPQTKGADPVSKQGRAGRKTQYQLQMQYPDGTLTLMLAVLLMQKASVPSPQNWEFRVEPNFIYW